MPCHRGRGREAQDRDRHRLAIGGGRVEALHLVARGIMPRRHLLPLEDHLFARLEVVVERHLRFGGRGEGEAQRGALIFRADGARDVAHSRAGAEELLCAIAPVARMDRRAILAERGPDEPILQHIDGLDRAAWHFIDQHFRLVGVSLADGERQNAIILGFATGFVRMVGADDQAALMVVDLVFDARLAREDRHRHLARVIEIEQQNLGGFVVVDIDEGVAIILRAIEADEPA